MLTLQRRARGWVPGGGLAGLQPTAGWAGLGPKARRAATERRAGPGRKAGPSGRKDGPGRAGLDRAGRRAGPEGGPDLPRSRSHSRTRAHAGADGAPTPPTNRHLKAAGHQPRSAQRRLPLPGARPPTPVSQPAGHRLACPRAPPRARRRGRRPNAAHQPPPQGRRTSVLRTTPATNPAAPQRHPRTPHRKAADQASRAQRRPQALARRRPRARAGRRRERRYPAGTPVRAARWSSSAGRRCVSR